MDGFFTKLKSETVLFWNPLLIVSRAQEQAEMTSGQILTWSHLSLSQWDALLRAKTTPC